MGKGVAEWTDRRLNDLAAALEPVPARVAALEATVDHLAEENRMLRAELATTQRLPPPGFLRLPRGIAGRRGRDHRHAALIRHVRERDLGPQPRAAAVRALEREGSPEALDAIGEPAQAASLLVRAPRAVVGDRDLDAVVAALDPDEPLPCAGMLLHIGECLRDDVVRGRLDRLREPPCEER